MNSKKLLFGTVGIALFALTACKNDNNNNDAPPIILLPVTDTFTVAVQNVAANAPDDAEPTSTEAFTATSPENTEPISL